MLNIKCRRRAGSGRNPGAVRFSRSVGVEIERIQSCMHNKTGGWYDEIVILLAQRNPAEIRRGAVELCKQSCLEIIIYLVVPAIGASGCFYNAAVLCKIIEPPFLINFTQLRKFGG